MAWIPSPILHHHFRAAIFTSKPTQTNARLPSEHPTVFNPKISGKTTLARQLYLGYLDIRMMPAQALLYYEVHRGTVF